MKRRPNRTKKYRQPRRDRLMEIVRIKLSFLMPQYPKSKLAKMARSIDMNTSTKGLTGVISQLTVKGLRNI